MRELRIVGTFLVIALAVFAMSQMTFRPVDADCADPSFPDHVAWENSLAYPATTQADSDKSFSSNQRFHWCYTSTPFMGAAEFQSAQSYNVEGVGYSPAYWFPSTNGGSVPVTWSGSLSNREQDGSVTTLGWCWSPYAEDYRTVTVLKP